MGAIIPIGTAKIVPAVGQGLGIQGAIQLARPVICSLYRSDPGWYTRSPSALGRDVGRVASLYMDDLCSDQPLPPPPQVPFQGGQCEGVSYRVTIRVENPSSGTSNTFTQTLQGALGGLSSRPTGVDPVSGVTRLAWRFTHAMTKANPRGTEVDQSNGLVTQMRQSVVSVVRVDGLPDTCGNPFPVDPPALSPPSVPVNINLPDIRVSPSATVVVPVVVFKPTLEVNPSLNVDFKVPLSIGGIEVNFDGSTFNVSSGDIVTQINTSITNSQTAINNNTNTSITNSQTAINNNTNTSITNSTNTTNTNITNARNTINNNTNTSITNSQTAINNNTNNSINSAVTAINNHTTLQSNSIRTDINAAINVLRFDLLSQIQLLSNLTGLIRLDVRLALEFLARIEAKPDCPELPPPPDEFPTPPVETPPGSGGDNPPKKKLVYVEVILTNFPDKLQFGNNGAQNVYFAGWIAFRSTTGSFYERQQINFQKSIFEAPKGSDGYTYTLTHGARGTIKEYYA